MLLFARTCIAGMITLMGISIIGLLALIRHLGIDTRPLMYRIVRNSIRLIFFIMGIRLHIQYQLPLSCHPIIFVANHVSLLDAFILIAAQKERSSLWLAHTDWAQAPLIGWFLRQFCIAIDPKNLMQTTRSLIVLKKEFAQHPQDITIFPEGTRSPDGTLLPFKPGAMLLARLLDIPIVPVYLAGAYPCLPLGAWLIQPGDITIRYGAPIPRQPTEDDASYAQRIHEWFVEQSQLF